MKSETKPWLCSIPWDAVVARNQKSCEAIQVPSQHCGKTGPAAQQIWERAVHQSMSLPDAFNVCRRCCGLLPFMYGNESTFAALATSIIEDWTNTLPPLEAQILRSTIRHYVADSLVSKRELLQVLSHFQAKFKTNGSAQPMASPLAQLQSVLKVNSQPRQSEDPA